MYISNFLFNIPFSLFTCFLFWQYISRLSTFLFSKQFKHKLNWCSIALTYNPLNCFAPFFFGAVASINHTNYFTTMAYKIRLTGLNIHATPILYPIIIIMCRCTDFVSDIDIWSLFSIVLLSVYCPACTLFVLRLHFFLFPPFSHYFPNFFFTFILRFYK